MCMYDIKDMMNSDEVSMLFRSISGRAVCKTNEPTAYERIKDQLNVTFCGCADGSKRPLIVIGKPKRRGSSRKSFCLLRNLGANYLHP